MTSPVVVCDEVLHWAETYTGPAFHAMLCDAPYEMHFMGRDWDRSGIAFRPDTWKALAQHLLPGAFGLCVGSARGWHRLATLLLPPVAYAPRRLLNPFAGSGSEAIGAVLAGWDVVVGIEQDPATVALAERRLAWWTTQIAAQLSLWPA